MSPRKSTQTAAGGGEGPRSGERYKRVMAEIMCRSVAYGLDILVQDEEASPDQMLDENELSSSEILTEIADRYRGFRNDEAGNKLAPLALAQIILEYKEQIDLLIKRLSRDEIAFMQTIAKAKELLQQNNESHTPRPGEVTLPAHSFKTKLENLGERSLQRTMAFYLQDVLGIKLTPEQEKSRETAALHRRYPEKSKQGIQYGLSQEDQTIFLTNLRTFIERVKQEGYQEYDWEALSAGMQIGTGRSPKNIRDTLYMILYNQREVYEKLLGEALPPFKSFFIRDEVIETIRGKSDERRTYDEIIAALEQLIPPVKMTRKQLIQLVHRLKKKIGPDGLPILPEEWQPADPRSRNRVRNKRIE